MRLFLAACTFLFASCGYRFNLTEEQKERTTVSVSYVGGDTEGVFTDELIAALTDSGRFEYRRDGGEQLMEVAIVSSGSEKIGYRYDRKGREGRREKNLLPTEGRHAISAQVTLVDPYSHEVIEGPYTVTASEDYDYFDYTSIFDLSFVNSKGQRQSSIAFSLGQLDSVEGADSDVILLLYRTLARKIVAGILYRAQEGCVNVNEARQSQIEAQQPERRSPSSRRKGEEEGRFGEVAASAHSQN